MDEKIPINANMPDDLKAAINYLNENHVSLTDKFEDTEDLENIDTNFGDVDVDSTEIDNSDDEISGEDADLSGVDFGDSSNVDLDDLDSIF